MISTIQLERLTKTFITRRTRFTAVDNISLDVTSGQVYGFLGPNGAGKTTTIRMVMDLMRPTSGVARIFGLSTRQPDVLRRVGALVEGPAFYGYLTGYDNLLVLAQARGLEARRCSILLEQVGLAEAAHRRTNQYSLGMKQRLGLAAALLTDPELVILDEPTNGLDPAGIIEMRGFIRDLATQHGKTVFLSSHLLNEVEQICDRVAIIYKGRLVREGQVAALLSEQTCVRVEAEPLDKAAQVLAEFGPVTPDGELALLVEAKRAHVPRLNQSLVENGVAVYQLVVEQQTLEEYFLSATSG